MPLSIRHAIDAIFAADDFAVFRAAFIIYFSCC